jgi:hypothetical protein
MKKPRGDGASSVTKNGIARLAACNAHLTKEATSSQSQHVRRRYQIGKLHRLGEAPLDHFIRDVERRFQVDLTELIGEYAELPVDFIIALGGDRFPGLIVVDGGPR